MCYSLSHVQLCNPIDCSLPGSSLHEILQARILEWAAISFYRGSSWPRDQTWVSCIAGRCFTGWATRETQSESDSVVSDCLRPHGLYSPWNSTGQNTGVGSCSLLQGVFPNQGLNPGLLHCRQILYQLSHKGRPFLRGLTVKFCKVIYEIYVCVFSYVQVFAASWSLPGSSVHGISQARVLQQVAISYSRGSSPPRDLTLDSCISAFAYGFYTTSATWEAYIMK